MKKPVLRFLRTASRIAVAVATLTSMPLLAADDERTEASRIDRWHDALYLKVQDWALGLDHAFLREGDRPMPTPSSPFRISTDAEVVQHSQGGTQLRGRLDIDLLLQVPNLERRLKIFVTSDDVEESPTLATRENRNLRAGARLALKDWLNFDVGARLDLPPYVFTALRWQKQLELGSWDVQPYAKIYLETRDGFGAATGVTFDHWHNRFLVRSSTYANWRKDEAAAEWTQTILFAHAREILRFGRYGTIVRGTDLVRAYGIQALASGERASGSASTYEISVFAKRPTGRNWLYWHVTPLVRWERERGWHADPGIRAGVDILFWDVSDR